MLYKAWSLSVISIDHERENILYLLYKHYFPTAKQYFLCQNLLFFLSLSVEYVMQILIF